MHTHLHAVSRFLVVSYFLLLFCDVIKHQSRYHMDLLKMTVCYFWKNCARHLSQLIPHL